MQTGRLDLRLQQRHAQLPLYCSGGFIRWTSLANSSEMYAKNQDDSDWLDIFRSVRAERPVTRDLPLRRRCLGSYFQVVGDLY